MIDRPISEDVTEAAQILKNTRHLVPSESDLPATREAWVDLAREVAYRLNRAGIRLDDLPAFIPASGVTAEIARIDPAARLELALTEAMKHTYREHD